MRDILEITIDLSNIVQDKAEITGENINDLIQIKIKNLSVTDQSKQIGSKEITFNNILPPETDLDNGEVMTFGMEKTIKEL